ncbi:Lipocalin-interacting membrane receptor,LMBR1-like membrane protein [Cinara cedri]|uniref:Lipocalin-interacting membrane receptor,LMBR1-like membrane protein n=1 Tax=Cinara cedri TaxID=506608 RepID=A0A5E4LZ98_9HEMI|nr:Lipocalin-interacting membrane receptor,LMBR1-like membrane protein [Cinara cedri]
MDDVDETDEREELFYNNVREKIIFLLLFVLLLALSYAIVNQYRKRDNIVVSVQDEDDFTVYKYSLLLCTISLAVSVGAALLLPISIVSNEVLSLYPSSYYVQWLNHSLIHGLWSLVFLFSNLSLFIFLPFAFLFNESEGFPGHRKGLKARVYETCTVLLLLSIFVLVLTYLLYTLFYAEQSLFYMLVNLWNNYLPFLYSCISFIGVLMLLICTPVGFATLFTILSRFMIKPQLQKTVDEEISVLRLEVDHLNRKLDQPTVNGFTYISPASLLEVKEQNITRNERKLRTLQNGELKSELIDKLSIFQEKLDVLEKQRKTSVFRKLFLYPTFMLLLLALTVVTVLLVVQNLLLILIGIKALPLNTRQFTLGVSSLSKLGPFGAGLEIVIILYMLVASTVGLYSLPVVSTYCPKIKQTPLTHIVGNCTLLLILSSALPLLSRILGITDFDLLADYGRIEWLGNFTIVALYNVVFVAAATLCLVNKFTSAVRKELLLRLKSFWKWMMGNVDYSITHNSSFSVENSPTITNKNAIKKKVK